MNPKQFQRITAREIVRAFQRGNKRFLLADEVGLGKTVVTKEVIQGLCAGHAGGAKVIYLCSSLEIADQNRSTLMGREDIEQDKGWRRVDRLTLYPAFPKPRHSGATVLCFTPGTSLELGGALGTIRERSYLYALLKDVLDWERTSKNRERFFACNVRRNSALPITEWMESQDKDFAVLEEMKQQLERAVAQFPSRIDAYCRAQGWDEQRYPRDFKSALMQIAADIVGGRHPPGRPSDSYRSACRHRNYIIGYLRDMLAKAAIKHIQPELIILDEFQRFPAEVMDKAHKEDTLQYQLFNVGARILLVSATPYKPFTTSMEDRHHESHYDSFRRTLAFLSGKPDAPEVDEVLKDLEIFRNDIRKLGTQTGTIAAEVIDRRNRIRERLRRVMFRTERFQFLLDKEQGTRPEELEHDLPLEREELREFFLLNAKARKLHAPAVSPTFWKSGAYLLSFMGGYHHYESVAELLDAPMPKVDKELYLPARSIVGASGAKQMIPLRNRKLRYLSRRYLEEAGADRHLWIPPCLSYYQTRTSSGMSIPKKLLIFSSWRFVPRMIGALLSHNLEARVRGEEQKSPLKLSVGTVMSGFYPSIFLAAIDISAPPYRGLPLAGLRKAVRGEIERRLARAKFVRADEAGPLKSLLLSMDMCVGKEVQVQYREAWQDVEYEGRPGSRDSEEESDEGNSEFGKARAFYTNADFHPTPTYVESQIEELVSLCIAGPGVSLLRSVKNLAAWGDAGSFSKENYSKVLRASYLVFRNYFNRPLVQRIVNQEIHSGSYLDRVLEYAIEFNLQAVLDELFYVLHDVPDRPGVPGLLDKFEDAILIKGGSIQVSARDRDGQRPHHDVRMATHFAVPFGDFAVDDEEATRKSRIRQAFNSPFWPFVLATTSVGQEGLDFHLYCSEILHWNLPSNPVEIEQREGRINRYNSLYLRRALSQTYAKRYVRAGANPWGGIFAAACSEQRLDEKATLGLFPNWIPAPRGKSESCGIKRIVLPYPFSIESERYRKLIDALATYRIAIGQPRQEELLREMHDSNMDLTELRRKCRQLMLNLMPFDAKVYRDLAHDEAQKILLMQPAKLRARYIMRLCDEAKEKIETNPRIRPEFASKMRRLLGEIGSGQGDACGGRRRNLLAALIYFINPFDEIPDDVGVEGFSDDEKVVSEALAR